MSQPWTPPPASGATANIQNYLVPAILATIFCCLPLGVVSIIFAAQVNGKIAAGDIAGAMESSRKAKMFMFVAIGLGLLTWIFAIVMWILFIGVASMGH